MRLIHVSVTLSAILAGCASSGQLRRDNTGSCHQPVVPAGTLAGAGSESAQAAAARPASQAASGEADAGRPAGLALGRSSLRLNDSIISVDDLLRRARPRLMDIKTQSQTVFRHRAGSIMNETVWALAGETLVLPEANKRLTDQYKAHIDQQVDQAMRDIVAHSGGSRLAAEQALRCEGTCLDEVLSDHRRYLTVRTYLKSKFGPAVEAQPKTLWDHYCRNIERYRTPRKVQMQTIAIPIRAFLPAGQPAEADIAAAKARAREAMALACGELNDGRSFEEVARKYSKDAKASSGGLWPLMQAGSFKEQKVEQAAFEMDQGQVSEVIETETGLFIVKAAVVQPGSTVSFEQAQADIEAQLRTEQYQRMENEHYRKLLQQAGVADGNLAGLFPPGHLNEFVTTGVQRAVEECFKPPSTAPASQDGD